jgi:hypothetical protein
LRRLARSEAASEHYLNRRALLAAAPISAKVVPATKQRTVPWLLLNPRINETKAEPSDHPT